MVPRSRARRLVPDRDSTARRRVLGSISISPVALSVMDARELLSVSRVWPARRGADLPSAPIPLAPMNGVPACDATSQAGSLGEMLRVEFAYCTAITASAAAVARQANAIAKLTRERRGCGSVKLGRSRFLKSGAG